MVRSYLYKLPLALVLVTSLGTTAYAQSDTAAYGSSSYSNTPGSWLPFTSYGYVGASVGRAEFDDLNCRSGFACERHDTAYKAFIGGQIRKGLGLELSYIDLGEGGANGGTTKARGINLSLIGNIPLGEQFNIYGKVGGTYGETKTSVSPLAIGAPSGDEDGFGVSYGAGVQLDFNRNWAARLEWDRYRFKYAESRQDSNLYSLGFLYKF